MFSKNYIIIAANIITVIISIINTVFVFYKISPIFEDWICSVLNI